MKIRIGNDFRYNWLILWNEEAESFTDATDKRLTVTVYGRVTELMEGTDYTITGNTIAIDFTPAICDKTGSYNLAFNYTKPSDKFIDGDRRSAVDVDAFIIVPKSEQSDSLEDITHTSDAVATFLDVAYQKLDEIEAAEVVREVAEEGRVTAEGLRVTAEQQRVIDSAAAVENANDAADMIYALEEPVNVALTTIEETNVLANQAEAIRATAETGRVTAEGLRVTAETSRAGAETNRVTSEGLRATAETSRAGAETGRATAEGVRVTNEQGRVAAEVLREENIQDAIDAATYANEQGAYAEEMSAHPPVIIADYWHNWNFTTNQYETTGQYARGDSAVEGALVVQTTGQSAVNTMSQKAVTDELVQLAGDVSVKMTQLLANGNFANGTDGWGGVLTVTNGVAAVSTSISGAGISSPIATTANNKYYISCKYKGNNMEFRLRVGPGGTIGYRTLALPTVSEMTKYATIATPTVDTTLIMIVSQLSGQTDFSITDINVINLNDIFGVDTPTLSEFNLLMSILGEDYFEGEITIPAQKVMQWQLKMIRQNRTAIIALGGTIV